MKKEETKIPKKIYSFKVSREFANVIERIRRKYHYTSLSSLVNAYLLSMKKRRGEENV